MDEHSTTHIFDAIEAAKKINRFVQSLTFAQYDMNELVQSAVARQFEILGEALNRLKKHNPELTAKIDGVREAISFRNLLAHGYDSVDNVIVWGLSKMTCLCC